MEIDASTLYNVALEQVMILQQQVIELKALYAETKRELDDSKSDDIKFSE